MHLITVNELTDGVNRRSGGEEHGLCALTAKLTFRYETVGAPDSQLLFNREGLSDFVICCTMYYYSYSHTTIRKKRYQTKDPFFLRESTMMYITWYV